MIQSAVILVTRKCNKLCNYCYMRKQQREEPQQSHMDYTVASQVANYLLKNSGESLEICFFGGEPLLNFDVCKGLFEILTHDTYFKQLRFTMTTNAELITGEIADWINQNHIGVTVSLDGWRTMHNVHRDSFDSTIRGMELIKWKTPSIRMTVTPLNVKYLAESVILLYDYGCSNMAVEPAYEETWTPASLDVLKEQFYDICYFRLKHPDLHTKFLEDGEKMLTMSSERKLTRCGLGGNSIGIDVDGSIYACHRFAGQKAFLLGDVWTGHKPMDFSRDKLVPPDALKCINCLSYTYCNGGCLAVNYDVRSDRYAVPWSWCLMQRTKAEVAIFYRNIKEKDGTLDTKTRLRSM